jgi:N-acetylmuramoyl-L-alanine amidase
LLIKVLSLTLVIALLPAEAEDSSQFLVFHKQVRTNIPTITGGLQACLPLHDPSHLVKLPCSKSAPGGPVPLASGRSCLRLAPLDFVSKALNWAFGERIAMAASSHMAAAGRSDLTRITARVADTSKVLRLEASRPVSAEVRQRGSRVVLAFGNSRVDFAGSDSVKAVAWVRSIALDPSEPGNPLVIELAGDVRTKISHLASQNAYLVEAIFQEGSERESEPSAGSAPQTWKWRHITVDAGHGGADRGAAIRENVFEKDAALAIARRLRWALETRLGVTVVLSRTEDQALGLEDRIAAANLAKSNLFISVHIGNTTASAAAHSYAYTARWDARESSAGEGRKARSLFVPWWEAQRSGLPWSERLAEGVQAELNRALNGGQALQFRRSPVKLLYALSMPAVLVEIGNASTPDFQASVESEQFQNLVAATLATAVEKFRPVYERP